MFSNLREHWQDHDRDFSRRGFWALAVYRFGRWRYGIRSRTLRIPFSFAYKLLKMLSEMTCGIEIPCETIIGRHFIVEHCGAIVISGDAVFGDHCVIRQGVTVGLRYTGQRGSPVIGNRCEIGAGAKLLGDIRIGDDVVIGANAVVLCDVPDGCRAVGVPARVRPRRSPQSPERKLVDKA
jgi:serine O-acetyltransferase